MNPKEIIKKTEDFVKTKLRGVDGSHDWWHAVRVRNMAMRLSKNEQVDIIVIELSALLHDIADEKLNDGDEQKGLKILEKFLDGINLPQQQKNHIFYIIKNISFRNFAKNLNKKSLEFMIVQDADRLDAIGAIGIARTFSYGGGKKRELFNPDIKPVSNINKDEYKKHISPTINHFYEKLLLLKDMMNTHKARQIAEHRHKCMEIFLDEFFNEWNGSL